jgi:sigma-B regulation protein RsbU (phosphoserine phosphatase)
VNQILLNNILDAHHSSFSQLADAWADYGASSVYLTDIQGEVLLRWPPVKPVASASFSAPLTVNGRSIGKLHITGEGAKINNTVAQLRLMTDARIMSDVLQMEYELQRMTTDIIDQQDQLMALHQLAHTSRVHHDLRQTLAALAQVTAQVLKTRYAFIALHQPNQPLIFEMHPALAWPAALWPTILEPTTLGRDNQEWLFQRNEDPQNAPPASLQNLLMKRVIVRSDVQLILGAADKADGHFQAPDLKVFSTIAGPAAATIENALFHQDAVAQARTQTEMDLARQVQMRLLSQNAPQVPGLSLIAQTQPASQVGGDFFDFMDSGQGILTFTLGDVSGKGMPAALLMTMVRTALRSKAATIRTVEPAVLLAQLNSALYQDFSDVDMFATIFVGQYDYRHHQLYYANDGHAPVIYRPIHGKAQLLPADAPPLGILDFNLAQQHQLTFHPGDILVVTSDGFSEAEKYNGELFGYERLLATVDKLATANINEMAEQLVATTERFTEGYPQSDDQTLLILQRCPPHLNGNCVKPIRAKEADVC